MLIKKKMYESGVNRLEHWIKSKDCGIISASRSHVIYLGGGELPEVKALETEIPEEIVNDEDLVIEYLKPIPKLSKSILRAWNFNLKDALRQLKYGVTEVQGIYTAPGHETEYEQSLFVVNLEDNPKFYDDIISFGEAYNQDCVLIKFKDEENAFLYGTNASPTGIDFRKSPFNAGKFHKYVGIDNMTAIRNRVIAFLNPEDGVPGEVNLPNFHARKAARIAAKLDDGPVTENGVPLAVEKALGYGARISRSRAMMRRANCSAFLRHFRKVEEGGDTDSLDYCAQYFFDKLVKDGIVKERRKGKYDVL
jgi:hypothetical protein